MVDLSHRDIVWDVRWCPYQNLQHLFATASADRTARIWSLFPDETKGISLLGTYTGHSGSVNSIRFHPTQNIVWTSSGDHSCHIWKCDTLMRDSMIGYVISFIN